MVKKMVTMIRKINYCVNGWKTLDHGSVQEEDRERERDRFDLFTDDDQYNKSTTWTTVWQFQSFIADAVVMPLRVLQVNVKVKHLRATNKSARRRDG